MSGVADGPQGRSELLFWFNSLCSADYPAVEALRDGAAYCAVVAATLRQAYAGPAAAPALHSSHHDNNTSANVVSEAASVIERRKEGETSRVSGPQETTTSSSVPAMLSTALARLDWSVTPRVCAVVDPGADDGLVRAACRHNFLILQDLLRRAVPPAWSTSIAVDRLAAGKLQDHVQLLQWLYRFLARVLLRRTQLTSVGDDVVDSGGRVSGSMTHADDALVESANASHYKTLSSGATTHTPPTRRHGTVEGVRLNRAVRLLEQKRHGLLLTPAKEPHLRRRPQRSQLSQEEEHEAQSDETHGGGLLQSPTRDTEHTVNHSNDDRTPPAPSSQRGTSGEPAMATHTPPPPRRSTSSSHYHDTSIITSSSAARHSYYMTDSCLVPTRYKAALLHARRGVEAIEQRVWQRHRQHGASLTRRNATSVDHSTSFHHEHEDDEGVTQRTDIEHEGRSASREERHEMPSLAELGQLLKQRDELAALHARVDDVVRRAARRRAALPASDTPSTSALLSDLCAILYPS